jgi:serine/threonine-protein kinase
MATVHLGRLLGPIGFSRTVAIKRSHPEFAADPEFVSMFLDEARLAARIRHPNVVQTLDVVVLEGDLFLVMDFVHGESLSKLNRACRVLGVKTPYRIACAIMAGVLQGLHAAHEAKNERGEPLGLVHRDVSPQNVIVGIDGIARVLDFGVAKAAGRVQTTRDGQIKGKIAYLAPEQLNGQVSRQSDIYAASVVLWETLTGDRLFSAENPGELLTQVLNRPVQLPSELVADIPAAVDAIVLRGLERSPEARYATAREMALALERAVGLASTVEVGEWVETVAKEALDVRSRKLAELETYEADEYDEQASGTRRATAMNDRLAQGRRGATDSAREHAADEPTRLEAHRVSLPPAPPAEPQSQKAEAIPERKKATPMALVAPAILFATVMTVWLSARARKDPPPMTVAPAPSPPVLAASVDERPVAPPDPQPATTSIAAPPPPSEVSAPPPVDTKAAGGRTGRAQPAVKKKRDCSSPYFIDADGIRHILPECLK